MSSRNLVLFINVLLQQTLENYLSWSDYSLSFIFLDPNSWVHPYFMLTHSSWSLLLRQFHSQFELDYSSKVRNKMILILWKMYISFSLCFYYIFMYLFYTNLEEYFLCQDMGVEVRGQCVEVVFLLLPCGFAESKSGCQP